MTTKDETIKTRERTHDIFPMFLYNRNLETEKNDLNMSKCPGQV